MTMRYTNPRLYFFTQRGYGLSNISIGFACKRDCVGVLVHMVLLLLTVLMMTMMIMMIMMMLGWRPKRRHQPGCQAVYSRDWQRPSVTPAYLSTSTVPTQVSISL